MKKSLLALAVAAAVPGVALAQSSVTLSGNVKIGLALSKFQNGTATYNNPGISPATAAVASNPTNNGNIYGLADGSSRFILSGVEDLGGGLKGIFQIDQRFRSEESPGSATAGGNTFVGLAGGFGQIRLGKLDLYYGYGTDEHGIRSTALQHSNISILSYVGSVGNVIQGATRSTNVIRYDSPNFGGATLGLAYSTGQSSGEGGVAGCVVGTGTPAVGNCVNTGSAIGGTGNAQKGQAIQGDLSFATGPFRVGVAAWDAKTEGYPNITAAGAQIGQKAVRGWGGFNFGIVDIGVTVDQSKIVQNGGDTKRLAFSVPMKLNLGPGVVLLTYSQAQNLKVNGATVNNTGARMIVLGYDYALSKRTSIGASFAALDNKGTAAQGASYAPFTGASLGSIANPTAGQDVKQLYLGVRHAF